jgi:hypothetical protein
MTPRRLRGLRPYRLYSETTAHAVYHEGRRSLVWVLVGIAPVFAGLVAVAHAELPFLAELAGACEGERYLALCPYSPLYDWLAGSIGLLVYAAYVVLLLRYVRRAAPPTVYCLRCDGAGWARDLLPTGGRCPFCRHDLFAYYRHAVPMGRGLAPVLEKEVHGETLIARQRAQGWWSRLYQPVI